MAIEIPSHVVDRLTTEQNIWLTTTRADGMPLPNTVWFLWHKGEFLIFTPTDSVKSRILRRNPWVSLNFNTNTVDGSDIAIFQGETRLDGPSPSADEFEAYLSKYGSGLQTLGISKETLQKAYILLRVKPIRFRTVTG